MRYSNLRGHILAMGVTLLIAMPIAAQAQSSAEADAVNPGSPNEGIKVHGDWTIVVHNQDGTVASRHEFENSLSGLAGQALVQILSRQANEMYWMIGINTVGSLSVVQNAMFIIEAAMPPTRSDMIPTLVVSAPTSGTDTRKLVLTASAKAKAAFQIVIVETYLLTCSPAVAANTPCASTAMRTFSQRDLTQPVPPDTTPPPPINVQSGQGIDVKVVFSFS